MQAAHELTITTEELGMEQPSDDHMQLIARVAENRDRDAFRKLFIYFGPRIKSMMLKSGAGNAEADDMVQDVMTKIWRNCSSYSPSRGAVSTWIFTIARNARIDKLRHSSSRPYLDVDEIEVSAVDDNAEQTVQSTQVAQHVSVAINQLPDEQRKIIELAFVHDMSQIAIANLLSLPLGTVKSRMRLAYAKLRPHLENLR